MDLKQNGCMAFPEVYWSPDREGHEVWGIDQLRDYLEWWGYELCDVDVYINGRIAEWRSFHYDVLANVHKACGFDPESDEVAKFLGLPLMEPFVLSEERVPHHHRIVRSYHTISVALFCLI